MSGRQILSVAEVAKADAAAIAGGTPGTVLMERAGTAVADAICARWRVQPALVLCGPGNNGGDGYVVARLLKERGWPVEVRAAGEPQTQDAQAASARWDGPVMPLESELGPGLWVDALFGAGLSRPLEGEAAAAAFRMAEEPARVVAIDIPSGVPGDTGRPLGPTAASCSVSRRGLPDRSRAASPLERPSSVVTCASDCPVPSPRTRPERPSTYTTCGDPGTA